ncbi:MAG: serine/threonine protein kinase [Deltaproteobacteria bacterium]|nr:serine/threonine protein kinase [Deltaproteobacteria bacterium]
MSERDDEEDLPIEVAVDVPVAQFGRTLPARLGRYTLTSKLGAGGMAEVFLAHVEAAGVSRRVVCKVLLPHLADNPKFVAMFRREAELAARLYHANIVQVLELAEADGTIYLVMERIDGIPLNQLASNSWKRRRSVPLELCALAVADAAAGLQYIHDVRTPDGRLEELVHRDISPDNLMVARDGVTKILDFGIAKSSTAQSVTRSGEIKGKVPFMAPEVIRGEEFDRRADIYALGVSFYWLVTGRRPFRGKTEVATMQSVLSEPLVSPRALNPTLPEPIEQLITKMLSRDAAARPQHAGEIHEALTNFQLARRRVVVPFVERAMAEGTPVEGSDASDPGTDGFLPSVPSIELDGLYRGRKSDPHGETENVRMPASTTGTGTPVGARAPASAPADDVAPPDTAAPPTPSSAPARAPATSVEDDDGSLAPVRRLPRLAVPLAAGAAVLGAVVLTVVLRGGSDEPPAAPAPPVTPPTTPTTAPPPPPVPAPPPPEAEAEPPPPAPPAKGKVEAQRRSVEVRAPQQVKWLDAKTGKALGSGNATLSLDAGAKRVVAHDTKRGGKTVVTLGAGPIDYAKLPHGQLQVRASPYAEVFVGKERLGTTPLSGVSLVAGSYTVKLVWEQKSESKNVDIKADAIERVTHRFQ